MSGAWAILLDLDNVVDSPPEIIMKFLSHMRSRSRLYKNNEEQTFQSRTYESYDPRTLPPISGRGAVLPNDILKRILALVCPHTQDESYVTSEDSMTDGGCMLCDMRDLAQCALVKKAWSEAAAMLLYHSVRIDAVHYCEQSLESRAKPKRRSFFERNTNSKENSTDAPRQRLKLFARTVRSKGLLASQVRYLKMSYMTRESCKTDLARTISVLPNLRYVDLPEGFYSDDPASNILKQELRSRCPDIRSMKYISGAESSFTSLGRSKPWRHLEALELIDLEVEPAILVQVLSSLSTLRQLRLANLPLLDDDIFKLNSTSFPMPPLTTLSLEGAPNISADGLVTYLLQPHTRAGFTTLNLVNTGIHSFHLHHILAAAPRLSSVHISETVTRALPPSPIPPLKSASLETLHFEISTASTFSIPTQDPADSYYAYLSSSLLQGGLPSLASLYALSSSLPSLLLPPPAAPFARTQNRMPAYGLSRPLELFTKSISELEWNLTLITPPTSHNRRGSASITRPVSLYNTSSQLGPVSGRDSMIVGNGFGGFLEVPNEDARPRSSAGGRATGGRAKGGRGDAWMG